MDRAIVDPWRIALPERRIDFFLGRIAPHVKPQRENSDDRVIDSVQRQGFSQRCRVAAESFSPQTIADKRDRRAVPPVFLRRELAAESELYAQRAEESRGDLFALKMLRRPRARQVESLKHDRRHLLKGSRFTLPILEIGIRDGHLALQFQADLRHHHQPVRFGERQGREQHSFNDAEDRGVRAHAERERQNRGGRESRAFPQGSASVKKVA